MKKGWEVETVATIVVFILLLVAVIDKDVTIQMDDGTVVGTIQLNGRPFTLSARSLTISGDATSYGPFWTTVPEGTINTVTQE
jgi:hypothetical protein